LVKEPFLSGKRIGYIRVSSFEQNLDRQLDNIQVDRLFKDKVSGKDTNRPGQKALLDYVRDGDTVLVHSMDRLARNLDDLRHLVVHDLTKRGVRVEFVKESLVFNGDDSPMTKLMLSLLGSFAEFEREKLRERQSEGIALAKKRGVYKGRKKALTDEQVTEMKRRIAEGEKKAHVAREFSVSRETIYKYLRAPN
jgi:DNA invertase Pin-like site-specific DNA recombinase